MFGCMHALLLATASTLLLDVNGRISALQWAGGKRQPNTTELNQQHAPAPPLLASPVAPPDAGKAVSSPPA